MFGLFRLIGIVVALAVAAVVVEPSWNEGDRSLKLRVRSVGECVAVVRALGDRVSRDRLARSDRSDEGDPDGARDSTPPVAAGPVSIEEAPQARITDDEREALDRLIEEKTREE